MIRATLVTEGSSDQVLRPILSWLLASICPRPVELIWADLRGVVPHPKGLRQKIDRAIELYPCDMVFVHRDRDQDTVGNRSREIHDACNGGITVVPVVPIQMQEAWLLIDEDALRRAAGRPTGRIRLDLPKPSQIEAIADPKERLHRTLRLASETKGRRAQRFRPSAAAHRLAHLIDDWSALERLSAFKNLKRDTQQALNDLDEYGIRTNPSPNQG